MKNKKAWLRIVEAFIAILLIATVILYIYPQINKQNTSSEGIYDMQKKILDFVSNDQGMRAEAVRGEHILIDAFIVKNLPSNWDFKINICKVNEICNDGIPLDKDVFVSESLISATVTDYPGKTTTKIRFFIWRR
ncbi:hypothetical protein J4456_01030 [Candidatus Pacearchaeota archaeon]|nr:hypothetical protein [Candidatus Pacearchaeota archaeon]